MVVVVIRAVHRGILPFRVLRNRVQSWTRRASEADVATRQIVSLERSPDGVLLGLSDLPRIAEAEHGLSNGQARVAVEHLARHERLGARHLAVELRGRLPPATRTQPP